MHVPLSLSDRVESLSMTSWLFTASRLRAHTHTQHTQPTSTQLPVTVPKPFSFTLHSRLQQRREFDNDLKKRQYAAEERDRIAREQQQREEEQELKKYRKSLNFKVSPVSSEKLEVASTLLQFDYKCWYYFIVSSCSHGVHLCSPHGCSFVVGVGLLTSPSKWYNILWPFLLM